MIQKKKKKKKKSGQTKQFLIQVGQKNQEQTATITSSFSISCSGGCSCIYEGPIGEEKEREKEERNQRGGRREEEEQNQRQNIHVGGQGGGGGGEREGGGRQGGGDFIRNLFDSEHSSAILFLLLGILIYILRNYFGVKVFA